MNSSKGELKLVLDSFTLSLAFLKNLVALENENVFLLLLFSPPSSTTSPPPSSSVNFSSLRNTGDCKMKVCFYLVKIF